MYLLIQETYYETDSQNNNKHMTRIFTPRKCSPGFFVKTVVKKFVK